MVDEAAGVGSVLVFDVVDVVGFDRPSATSPSFSDDGVFSFPTLSSSCGVVIVTPGVALLPVDGAPLFGVTGCGVFLLSLTKSRNVFLGFGVTTEEASRIGASKRHDARERRRMRATDAAPSETEVGAFSAPAALVAP